MIALYAMGRAVFFFFVCVSLNQRYRAVGGGLSLAAFQTEPQRLGSNPESTADDITLGLYTQTNKYLYILLT